MAAESDQPTRRAAPLRGNRQPPRRGKVERLGIAPELADHSGEAGASYPLLHRPQRIAGIARLDMDEVSAGQPGRVDPPAFEYRHPLLHPQQRFVGRELRQQEPGPAAIARMSGEQLGEGRLRCFGQAPIFLRKQEVRRHARLGSCLRRSTSARRGDGSAGDQRQASCHTTHNVFVLLLFLSRDSLAGVNPATRSVGLRLYFLEEFPHFADNVLHSGGRYAERHVMAVELGLLVALMIKSACSTRRN